MADQGAAGAQASVGANAVPARIVIGVSTYNRGQMVAALAQSLRALEGIEQCRVIVLDDCSTEYDGSVLPRIFPPQALVYRNMRNTGGADVAAVQLYRLLAAEDADLVISIDSDMLIASHALQAVRAAMPRTDGVLSLFNTPNHADLMDSTAGEPGSEPVVRKASFGNGCVAWRRDLLHRVLQHVPVSESWDWQYCRYLTAQNVRLLAMRQSLVLHIGYLDGQNSSVLGGDYGVGFEDFTAAHTAAMFEAIGGGLKLAFRAMSARMVSLETRVAELERASLCQSLTDSR